MDDFVNAFFGFQPQRRQHHQGGQQGGHQGGQAPAQALLMQFLPILLLAFLSLFSGSLNGSNETSFTFGRNAVFGVERHTTKNIVYFVQREDNARLDRDRTKLYEVEKNVDREWRRRLHTDCQFQMREKQRRLRDAERLNDPDKKAKARAFSMTSCDELRERYNEQPGDYHDERRQYRQYRYGYRL